MNNEIAKIVGTTREATCPACSGSGTTHNAGIFWQCRTCPDDGSGQAVGTGKVTVCYGYTHEDLLMWLAEQGHIVTLMYGKPKAEKPNPHAAERCTVFLFAADFGPIDKPTAMEALEALVLGLHNGTLPPRKRYDGE